MSPSVTVRLLGTQSDARLVELARNGHERAFEALVQRYRRPLLGYCRRVLLPEARAEDALQQALLQAWLALQRGDDVRDARAWLYRIVHNTALNALRSSGYDYAELSEAITGAGAPQEDLDRRIAVREALAGLATLPEQQREALLRTAVEGASHAAVAAEMGLSEGALRGLVYRARTSLRTAVTAITPMPLATWAAGAAGHGAAVAELAVGGGSAGVAGLLAKGGVVLVAAGVVAAGVGGVAIPHRARPRSHPADAARAAATVPQERADGGSLPGAAPRGGGRPAALTPISLHRAPEVPVRPRDGGSAGGGGGHAPGLGTSGGGDGHGDLGGTGPGGPQGRGGLPGSGTAPSGSGDGGGSGSSGSGGSGDGGHGGTTAGSGDDGGGSGSSGTSGGDGSGSSGSGSGDTGSSGGTGSGSGGSGDSGSGTSTSDGGSSTTGSSTDGGATTGTTSGGDG